MKVAAGKFKAQCLKLIDEVGISFSELVITKHGKPVAKLIPISSKEKISSYGCAKHSILFMGDILSPIQEKWVVNEL